MATEIKLQGSLYNTVAASQTTQILSAASGGSTGKQGDYLARVIIVPATSAAGAVTLLDGSTSISLFAGGAVTALSDLKPLVVNLSALSNSGAWKVTTGANVSVIAIGQFS